MQAKHWIAFGRLAPMTRACAYLPENSICVASFIISQTISQRALPRRIAEKC
jgi:hypothetical protein